MLEEPRDTLSAVRPDWPRDGAGQCVTVIVFRAAAALDRWCYRRDLNTVSHRLTEECTKGLFNNQSQDIVFGRMIMENDRSARPAEPNLRARTDQGVARVRVEKRDLLRDPARIGTIIMVPGDSAHRASEMPRLSAAAGPSPDDRPAPWDRRPDRETRACRQSSHY